MIFIIAGASHTGKTLLAQRLLEKLRIPYLSLDHLKMGLIRSRMTDLTPMDDGKMTDFLFPIVAEMMKTAIENNQHMIVEGCYIPAEWQKAFPAEYLPHIRSLCLVMTERHIREHFHEISSHACAIEQRLDDSGLTADSLIADNLLNLKAWQEHRQPVVLIDGDYTAAVNAALDACCEAWNMQTT